MAQWRHTSKQPGRVLNVCSPAAQWKCSTNISADLLSLHQRQEDSAAHSNHEEQMVYHHMSQGLGKAPEEDTMPVLSLLLGDCHVCICHFRVKFCPDRTSHLGVVLVASQMLSRLSLPPDASWRPSAHHFRPHTSWLCPWRVDV